MRFLSLRLSCLLLPWFLSACVQISSESTHLPQDPHVKVYFNHKQTNHITIAIPTVKLIVGEII